jgi:hypothetical protein
MRYQGAAFGNADMAATAASGRPSRLERKSFEASVRLWRKANILVLTRDLREHRQE